MASTLKGPGKPTGKLWKSTGNPQEIHRKAMEKSWMAS
jgi:hypothetical protein